MNTLSWLIYAADVLGSVKGLLIAVAIVGMIVLSVAMLAAAIGASEPYPAVPAGTWKKPLRFMWVPIVAGLIAALIPSTRTLYMIAASEAGEAVVTSPDAIEMMGDLKAIIKQKLKAELGEAK